MEFLFICILGLIGLTVGTKVAVYFGTMAYFEARHAFYTQFKGEK